MVPSSWPQPLWEITGSSDECTIGKMAWLFVHVYNMHPLFERSNNSRSVHNMHDVFMVCDKICTVSMHRKDELNYLLRNNIHSNCLNIYTAINFTSEHRNVSVALRWQKWAPYLWLAGRGRCMEFSVLGVAGWACLARATHAPVSASQQEMLSSKGARVYTCTCPW